MCVAAFRGAMRDDGLEKGVVWPCGWWSDDRRFAKSFFLSFICEVRRQTTSGLTD